jgi:hypothetical protein
VFVTTQAVWPHRGGRVRPLRRSSTTAKAVEYDR